VKGPGPADPNVAQFNEACSDRETISRQLGIVIPGAKEDRPEDVTFEDLARTDRQLFEVDGKAGFWAGPSGQPSEGVASC